MNLIKATVIGLDAFKAQIASASKELQADVDGELQAAAMEFVALAKRDVASQGGDRGTLLRSISYSKDGNLSYTVSANAFYAPFIEFGTKTKFKPYPGTEEFASQYRGGEKRGDWMDMLKSIYLWVVRKNIGATYKIGRAHV